VGGGVAVGGRFGQHGGVRLGWFYINCVSLQRYNGMQTIELTPEQYVTLKQLAERTHVTPHEAFNRLLLGVAFREKAKRVRENNADTPLPPDISTEEDYFKSL
jgi:hypothetical protein